MMHAATLSSSRLQRVLKLLADNKPHSTRDIMRRTHVCAISACIAELRHNGAEITCERQTINGKGIFFYKMISAPGEEDAHLPEPLNFMDDK